MKLDKEDKESQPDPTRDLIMGQIGDESHDDDLEVEGDDDFEEDEDDEEDESSADTNHLRDIALASVGDLYQCLQEANLSEEAYSNRRAVVDDLTKNIVRIPFIPDEEVVEAFYTFRHEVTDALEISVLDLVLPNLRIEGLKENEKYSFSLSWWAVTLINLINNLESD